MTGLVFISFNPHNPDLGEPDFFVVKEDFDGFGRFFN